MDEKIENITSTLDLEDSVKTLILLTMLECSLCKDILHGKLIEVNCDVLPLISEMYYKIFYQIDGFVCNSKLASALSMYRETRDGYFESIKRIKDIINEKYI